MERGTRPRSRTPRAGARRNSVRRNQIRMTHTAAASRRGGRSNLGFRFHRPAAELENHTEKTAALYEMFQKPQVKVPSGVRSTSELCSTESEEPE
ncbi:hypothetical protein EJB05_41464 [Eragrostis curvula]|uniref:Uncharacterized protein n=1 Tax=Eragrostis curvula TaxID=38414 RepID=A0A5J9T9S4_9POAL|nr:hypothetical protein EJB05_41464 [Eragrostis curvula]